MPANPDDPMDALVRLIANSTRTWVLTGAGISTESGLPDYRGSSGLWRSRRFEELASVDALRDEPEEFWEFYRMRLDRLGDAEPNAAHLALAEMQRAGHIERVVTQNVDGLHTRAGSADVIELHGSLREARCRSCGFECGMDEARRRWTNADDGVPLCDCGSVLGPGVVLFGEPLPLTVETAFGLAETCDCVLALGTTLQVFPAAHLPVVTVERGGRLGIVNRGTTEFDSLAEVRIDSRLGALLPRLAGLLDRA